MVPQILPLPLPSKSLFLLIILSFSLYSEGLRAGRLGFDSRQRKIFLSSMESRLVLGCTHFPIQCESVALVLGIKRPELKLTTHRNPVPRSGMVELCFHSSIRVHGIVLNKLSTETTLSFNVLQPKPLILSLNRPQINKEINKKNVLFCDVALCRSCVNRRFRGTYRLHLQGRKIRER
jgi:hypothetical protein